MQRNLSLTIRLDDGHIEIDLHEPESGEVNQLEAPFSPDEHQEFNKAIGNEIYAWLKMWSDGAEGAEL